MAHVAIYREATGGTSITSTWATLDLDTTVAEDSDVFSESGGVVTLAQAGRYIASWGSNFDTNGNELVACKLQVNGANYDGGWAYCAASNANGVDSGRLSGVTLIDATAGDTVRLQMRSWRSTTTVEEADSTYLQLIRVPDAFACAAYSQSSIIEDIGTSWVNHPLNATEFQDTGFSISSGTITVADAGRYLVISQLTGNCQAFGGGDGEGGELRGVVEIDGAAQGVTWHRKPMSPGNANESRVCCHTVQFIDTVSSDQAVNLQYSAVQKEDATDEVDLDADGTFFALIRIPDDGGSADYGRIYPNANLADINGNLGAISWDAQQENPEGPSFSHETVTNPDRLNLLVTGRYLVMWKASLAGTVSRGTDDCAWSGAISINGTDLKYGQSGSSVHRGDVGTQMFDESDFVAFCVIEATADDICRATIAKEGTSSETDTRLLGGSWGGARSGLTAIRLDDWPTDTFLAPTAAAMSIAVPDPVVSRRVLPTAATTALVVPDPIVGRAVNPTPAAIQIAPPPEGGSLRIGRSPNPTPATIPIAPVDPIVQRDVNPTPAAIPVAVVDPIVQRSVNPTAAAVLIVAPDPVVTLGINILPTPAAVALVAPDPIVARSPNPTAATIPLAVPDPIVGRAMNPTAVAIPIVAPDPIVSLGEDTTIVVSALAIPIVAADPSVVVGTITQVDLQAQLLGTSHVQTGTVIVRNLSTARSVGHDDVEGALRPNTADVTLGIAVVDVAVPAAIVSAPATTLNVGPDTTAVPVTVPQLGVGLGGLAPTPTTIVVDVVVPTQAIVLAPFMVTPDPTVVDLAVPGPSTVEVAFRVVPDPAAAQVTVPQPSITVDLFVVTPDPTVVSLAIPGPTAHDLLTIGPVALLGESFMAAAPAFVVVGFYETIARAVRSRWIDQVATPLSLTTQYDALPFAKPTDELWARISVEFEQGQEVEAGGQILLEARGALRVALHTPLLLGTKAATDTADSIVAAFREVTVADVEYGTPRTEGRRQNGESWVLGLACPFLSRQVVTLPASTGPWLGLDHQEIGEVIRARWKTQVADQIPLATQYGALPFTKPASGTAWARLTILPGEGFQTDLNGSLHRVPGVAIAQVWTAAEGGSREGLVALDTISEAFRHRSDQGVVFGAPRVGRGRREGDEWVHTITVPWDADMATV